MGHSALDKEVILDVKRLETVETMADVLDVCLAENTLSRRMSRVLEKRIDALIQTETMAITQMKRYKDKASTAGNYRKAVHAKQCLNKAVDSLVDDNAGAALESLRLINEEPPAPTRRKKAA